MYLFIVLIKKKHQLIGCRECTCINKFMIISHYMYLSAEKEVVHVGA